MADQPEDFYDPPIPIAECPGCGHYSLYYVETLPASKYGDPPEPAEGEYRCLCLGDYGAEGCKCDWEP